MVRRGTTLFLLIALVATTFVSARAALGSPTVVRRDAFGVPHITAPSQHALAFTMGLTLAEDRPFQLDLYRRAGSGRLSEVLGAGSDDEYLRSDILMRQEFYDRARLQAEVDAWDPELRDLWEAYGRGIDAGWAKVLANPATHPIEFIASGYEPEPWTTVDSLAVTLLFSIVDNGAWGGDGEFENAALLQRLTDRNGAEVGEQMWNEAIWMNDADASTVIGDEEASEPPAGVQAASGPVGAAQSALLGLDIPLEQTRSDDALLKKVISDLALPRLGSYAVAVSPGKSASGSAMFLGAPQSGISAPPVVWEVGMHAPGIDCAGGAVPGAGPFIIMGRCRHHAFSVVAGVAGDTVDVVVEQRSGDGYVYDGAVEPFERRTETFTVRGIDPTFPPETVPVSYRTETHEFLRSRHGPVFDLLDDVAYARKRAQEGHIIDNLTSLFHLTTAQTYAEADAAVEEASWSVHTVYADIEGHIAYWYSGLNPIRSIDPRLPTPGHSSEYEWAGFIPKDQNPQVVDPASGVVVANQGYDSKPVSWWPFSDDWRISRIERRRVTEALVADRVPVDNADIEQINRLACCDIDPIVSLVADAAREAVALHPTQRRAEAIAYLDAWEASGFVRADTDGDGRYDEPGIAIWGADEMPSDVYHGTLPIGPIWDRLFHLTFPDELPAFAYYGYQDRLNPTDRALRHARGLPTGVPLGRDYFDNVNTPATETWHELLVQAIDEGLATVQGRFGTSEMSAWRDPVNTLEVRTLGAADVAPVKGFDHSSYNFIVDFASATDSGRSVLPPGQGAPISAVAYAQFLNDRTYPEHFVDQVEMYENFEFKPMRLFPTEYGSAPVALTFVAPPATTNHRPHASDDLARTDESAPVLVDVLANDYDADGDAVVLSGVSSAAHGLTSIEAGKIRYSPARNFNGTDTFTYSVSDARGGTDTATVDVTVAAVFAPTSLVVNVGGPGVGSVSSDPAGIACPGDCAHDFDEGSSVVLTAAAGQASRFDGWSGACAGSASTCDVSMSAARSVGARFARGKKPV